MSKKNPYFSFDGQAFQTPGSALETAMNIKIAMEKLHYLASTGGGHDDAMTTLAYLEDQNPKLERLCDDMRIAFLLDPFDDEEQRRRIIVRAYNGIVDRMNARPITWTR